MLSNPVVSFLPSAQRTVLTGGRLLLQLQQKECFLWFSCTLTQTARCFIFGVFGSSFRFAPPLMYKNGE